jgi:hypothetical protein
MTPAPSRCAGAVMTPSRTVTWTPPASGGRGAGPGPVAPPGGARPRPSRRAGPDRPGYLVIMMIAARARPLASGPDGISSSSPSSCRTKALPVNFIGLESLRAAAAPGRPGSRAGPGLLPGTGSPGPARGRRHGHGAEEWAARPTRRALPWTPVGDSDGRGRPGRKLNGPARRVLGRPHQGPQLESQIPVTDRQRRDGPGSRSRWQLLVVNLIGRPPPGAPRPESSLTVTQS